MVTPIGASSVRDLGTFNEPILLFGGPYSNLQATMALLAETRRLGIPTERIICTGDVVAYGGDPQDTVDAVRSAGIAVVMGNCEESLGFDHPDCGCGFAEDSVCDMLSVQWFAHARDALDTDAKAWMRTLPRRLLFRMSGRRIAVIHGGGTDISRFVFASTPISEKQAELDRLDADGAVGGHAGLPFTQTLGRATPGRRMWHNPGVIGLPANDGTPNVWFSILAPASMGIEITHFPLAYDHTAAAASMREKGLPEAYARTLTDGLWPAMDVLPQTERELRGRPLAPIRFRWSDSHRSAA